jgi:hypothetical protein
MESGFAPQKMYDILQKMRFAHFLQNIIHLYFLLLAA